MNRIDTIDWALFIGVLLLGWFLAVYFKSKYKLQKRDFVVASLFVACLTAIIIGAYHILRGMLVLTP